LIIRLVLVAAAVTGCVLLALGVSREGNNFLAIAFILVALVLVVVNLRPNFAALRWMNPALVLVILLTIYPLLYTVYIAFTNYSDGHRYTKQQAVDLLADRFYLPEGGVTYEWALYRDAAGEFALWLTDENGEAFFAAPGDALIPVASNESGQAPYDRNGLPASIEGYALLEGGERFQALSDAQNVQFGPADAPIGIQSRSTAGAFQPKWVFDEAQNALIDRETNTVYAADDSQGVFRAANGQEAPLGYWVPIGLGNFTRILESPLVRGPLVRVFAWTVAFAFFSVTLSFALGLFMALILNRDFRGVRAIRSLLVIPYAIPGIISILIWRGMLNPNVGVITTNIENLFGWAPAWFSDPGWAKVAVLLVNLWLTYPYFMLICSGALQSISTSIYEAAEVDGANRWEQFWNLTLPLLLVAVGPLLVASFTFNFNNFMVVEALFQGGPPMAGTSAPPVGHTDNLISYTFRFAFGSGGTRDFGFASAIAIVIFFIVGTITLLQFRFTRRLEEVGENV
jgi:ABC-type sugar transport system permease subunit